MTAPIDDTNTLAVRWRRLRALMKKEWLQILRDPSALLVALVLPLFLLFMFGYGVSLDASSVRLGLAIESPTSETSWFQASLENTPFFKIVTARHRAALDDELMTGHLDGIVVLAGDFSQKLARGETAPVQIITDGSDPNTAGLVSGYVQGAWQSWLAQRALSSGAAMALPIRIEPQVWFNPELKSRRFLVPGSIALIQMLIGTLLTALVVAREWERGTIESLLATPTGVAEFLISKLVPNFMLGMAAMVVSVTAAVFLFDIPLRGSLLALVALTAAFQACALSVGLLASTVSHSQFVATQIAMFASFLPGFFLSGFIFDLSGTPLTIRILSYIVPARYYVQGLQTIFLAGDVPGLLLRCMAALLGLACVLLLIVVRKTKTRLD